MRKITDNDLTLLYYGEHDDPELAIRVAESEELSARYDALCDELQVADDYAPPERGQAYGEDVWQRIAPRLNGDADMHTGRLKSWLSSLSQPRFSLAGAFSMVLVAVLAFVLDRDAGLETPSGSEIPVNEIATALAGIDSNRLLSHSVSGHLEQVNIVLTQFANSTESSPNESTYATDMLVANRLYRQAAVSRGNQKLAAFLAELEPLLIEMAHEAQSGSAATRERMQKEVRDGLLFRVRIMNKQLNQSEISV